jgi:site-specific DNA recombinase
MRDLILAGDLQNLVAIPAVGREGLGRNSETTKCSAASRHAAEGLRDSRTFANAVAYLRVSTDQQADSGLGIDAQRATVTAAAARLGLTLRAVLVDAGISGARAFTARPVLVQAVSALRRGEVLLVAKRDRLGRDAIEVGIIERLIVKSGARVLSAAGEGTDDDDPASVMFRGIIDLFAQYERLIGRARTKAALAVKRARGERTGQLPFGFQLAEDGVHLEPNPVEQDKLERIRALKATGRSCRKIAADLNAEGVTTRRGGLWRFQYVARALRSA